MSAPASLVSVIITTCDRPELLRLAIESVLGQTYDSREVIVVDAGSQDDARQVVAGFGPKVRYVHKGKASVSAARNTGIAEAAGEWIAFLDDDDRWQPEKLERQISIVAHFREPVLVCTNGWKGGGLFRDRRVLSGLLKQDQLTFPTPPSSWLVNRRLLDTVGGFDESYNGWEDVNFLTRACRRGVAIYYLSDPLVFWGSETGRPHASDLDLNKIAEREKNLAALGDFIRGHRHYYFRYLYSLGKDCRKLGDRDRARGYFRQALAVEPWHPGLFVKCLRMTTAIPGRGRGGSSFSGEAVRDP